jgi:hypothetical protein
LHKCLGSTRFNVDLQILTVGTFCMDKVHTFVDLAPLTRRTSERGGLLKRVSGLGCDPQHWRGDHHDD